MYTEKIKLANIMCSGCANTIKNELLKLTGVKNVQVDLENKIVILSYENLERNLILSLLSNIGYPAILE